MGSHDNNNNNNANGFQSGVNFLSFSFFLPMQIGAVDHLWFGKHTIWALPNNVASPLHRYCTNSPIDVVSGWATREPPDTNGGGPHEGNAEYKI